MSTFENTFVRGPSPSYSDDAASEENIPTFPLGSADERSSGQLKEGSFDNNLDKNFNLGYDAMANGASVMKQGRNTFAFWTIITILFVLTVGNLILTLIIIGVLHLGKGIHGMELIPEEDAIKFYGTTDLDRIFSKSNAQIEGFTDVPMTVTGDDGGVYVRLHRNGQPHNRLMLDKSGIQFRAFNTFEVKDSHDGSTIFTTHRPHYNMPKGAEVLLAKAVSASKVSSSIGSPIKIDADTKISVKGSEGIILDAFSTLVQAEHNIVINATQGSIVIEAGSGIFLNMDQVPIVSSEFGLRTGNVQYKICVCMPRGTLFRIAIPRVHNGPKISCAHFNPKHDPCAAN